ncbi:MAG: amidohydrolase family protein, partial [Roseburia sp.]|nr:amidohydrolase family protein [Roseburia sp.]
MIIKNAFVFTLEQGFVKKDVVIEDGHFAAGEREPAVGEQVMDAAGNYLIPGLVDVHFHGCAGHDFSDGTPEALDAIGAYELKCGVTSICPASMTLAEDTLSSVCENAYAYKKRSENRRTARLCGVHLEGPFISMEKKGAQNPAFIQPPSEAVFRRLQKAAHGLVRLITIAPEAEGAEEFIRALSSEVHISVGHTTSDYKTASRAFALGAD